MLLLILELFVFAIVLFLFFTFFITFSNTLMGRLITILIVIFFTMRHPLLGVASCLIIIATYQYYGIHFENMTSSEMKSINDPYSYVDFNNIITKPINAPTNAPTTAPPPATTIPKRFNKDQYCNATQKVPNALLRAVYPELSFNNDTPCDPCNKNCKYSIIDGKLSTYNKLVIPKESNWYSPSSMMIPKTDNNTNGIFTWNIGTIFE